jgi:hypothetical protein
MTGGYLTVDSEADYEKWLRSKGPKMSSSSFE